MSANILAEETAMRREALPVVSADGKVVLDHYEEALRSEEDLSAVTIRNYLSDVRQFAAWYEERSQGGQDETSPFTPTAVATPTLTAYRAYLQHILHLKPASVNRSLVSLKRYFAWLAETGQIKHNPAKAVKLVEQEVPPPRHLSDQEEQALVAAVTEWGSLRDRTIIVLMLHTGLRAREVCTLTRAQVKLGKRSGTIQVIGKRNKYREIPLNATARAALVENDSSLGKASQDTTALFLSEKTHTQLTERGLGYLIKKYAERARILDVSPHDLRPRFGFRMAALVPLHRLAQLMGHDSLDTTLIYVRGTRSDLQQEVEKIAWI
jgi:integrase/recombinase XerD